MESIIGVHERKSSAAARRSNQIGLQAIKPDATLMTNTAKRYRRSRVQAKVYGSWDVLSKYNPHMKGPYPENEIREKGPLSLGRLLISGREILVVHEKSRFDLRAKSC